MRGFHNPNERPRGLQRARGGRQSTRSRPLQQSQTRRIDAVQLLRQLCRAASGPKASLISAVDGTLVPASHVDAAIRSTSTLLSHAGDLRPLVRSVEKGAHSTGEVLIREPAKLPSLHSGPPDPLSGSIPPPPPASCRWGWTSSGQPGPVVCCQDSSLDPHGSPYRQICSPSSPAVTRRASKLPRLVRRHPHRGQGSLPAKLAAHPHQVNFPATVWGESLHHLVAKLELLPFSSRHTPWQRQDSTRLRTPRKPT